MGMAQLEKEIREEADARCKFDLYAQGDLDLAQVTMGGNDTSDDDVERALAELPERTADLSALREARDAADAVLARNVRLWKAGDEVTSAQQNEAYREFCHFRNELAVPLSEALAAAADNKDQFPIGSRWSRSLVDLTPPSGWGTSPFMAAKVSAVSGVKMARAVGHGGGTGFITQFQRPSRSLEDVGKAIHGQDVRYLKAVTVTMNDSVLVTKERLAGRTFDDAIVVNDNGVLQGILHGSPSNLVLRHADHDFKISDLPPHMIRREKITTGHVGIEMREAVKKLREANCGILPILDDEGKVKGVVTRESAAMSEYIAPHESTRHGGFQFLATVSALHDVEKRVKEALDAGADAICLDTALFAFGIDPFKNVEKARKIIDAHDAACFEASKPEKRDTYKTPLIVANMTNYMDILRARAHGADYAVIGIGGGGSCSTWDGGRIGRPMFSTILECSIAARAIGGIYVLPDGGINSPDRFAVAMAAGGDRCLVGSKLGAMPETPRPYEFNDEGIWGKYIWGEASEFALLLRNRGRDPLSTAAMIAHAFGENSEGVLNFVPFDKKHPSTHHLMMEWLRRLESVCTYHSARNIADLHRNAVFHLVTPKDRGRPGKVVQRAR
jgi:IMP dehydrogenase